LGFFGAQSYTETIGINAPRYWMGPVDGVLDINGAPYPATAPNRRADKLLPNLRSLEYQSEKTNTYTSALWQLGR